MIEEIPSTHFDNKGRISLSSRGSVLWAIGRVERIEWERGFQKVIMIGGSLAQC